MLFFVVMTFAPCGFTCADDSGSLVPLGISYNDKPALVRLPEHEIASSSAE